MNDYSLLRRIIIGLKKKPLKLLRTIFVVYASIWAILEPLLGLVQSASQYFLGGNKFFVLVLVSIIIGCYKNAIPKRILIKYRNSSIEVEFGDLFSYDGFKVIPISRFFYETQVVSTSLQGQILKIFSDNDLYKQKISEALQGKDYKEIYRDETRKKEKYYPLGTAASLKLGQQCYILFALTETELEGCIPDDNCNASKMWIALESLWSQARIYARGDSVNIPLIGSGVTGIRLSDPNRLLELNLLAIANSIEEGRRITTEKIRIILHSNYIEDINLDDFRSIWNQ